MELKPKEVIERKIDSKGRVTIPASKRAELEIEEGDIVEFAVLGSH